MDLLNGLRKRSEGFSINGFDSFPLLLDMRLRTIYQEDTIKSPLLVCNFARCINSTHILASGNEDGRILIQNTRYLKSSIQESSAHQNAIFSIAWSEINMKLITGSGDHHVAMWDVSQSGSLLPLSKFQGHTGSIKSVAFKPQSSDVFVSGGRDGCINIWDSRNHAKNNMRMPDVHIKDAHSHGSNFATNKSQSSQAMKASITCVLFQSDNYILSCRDVDSAIKVWDIRRTYYTSGKSIPTAVYTLDSTYDDHSKSRSVGHTHMVLNKCRTTLYAHCTNLSITSFDAGTWNPKPVAVYKGQQPPVMFISKCALTPDDRYITCTSGENKLFAWKVGKGISCPQVRMEISCSGIAGLDWSFDGDFRLGVCTDYRYPLICAPYKEPSDDKCFQSSNQDENHITTCCLTLPTKSGKNQKNVSILQNSPLTGPSDISKLLEKLPNSVEDGRYQNHQCSKRNMKEIKKNWLSTFSLKSETSLCKLTPEHVVSPVNKTAEKLLGNQSDVNTSLMKHIKKRSTDLYKTTPSPKRRKYCQKGQNKNETLIKYFACSDKGTLTHIK